MYAAESQIQILMKSANVKLVVFAVSNCLIPISVPTNKGKYKIPPTVILKFSIGLGFLRNNSTNKVTIMNATIMENTNIISMFG